MIPEDASVIIGDLKELGIPAVGSIAIERIDSDISEAAERHAPGMPTAIRQHRNHNRSCGKAELSDGLPARVESPEIVE